ncbi:MAG TPA: FAD:protein FMN transferase [Pseudolysinimonas sp.]|nr:FAD:protein FMN transferase [Pseudolysinimonas sp.]
MRQTFDTMGTVVSLEWSGDPSQLDEVSSLFEAADRRFSLYRPDSELRQVADGTLELLDASAELREVYATALGWRGETGGAFTPHRPDGTLDLNGIVKAWAMSEAGRALGRGGTGGDWCLNVGGDVLVSGQAAPGAPWVVGIVDPADRAGLLTAVPVVGARRAVATSGSAERGDHIWTRGRERAEFAQVTVVADDIVTADVLATAIVSGGAASLDDLTARFDVDVLTVDREGALRATPGMRELVAK